VWWDAAKERWCAELNHRGERIYIGTFEAEEHAAIAADRLALHVGLGPVNFPERDLAPASLETLRAERFEAGRPATKRAAPLRS
jgi:hypothetical protein